VHRDVAIGQSGGVDNEMLPGRGTSNADRYYLASGQALTSETGDHVVAKLAGELDVTKPTGATAFADFVAQREEPLAEAPHTNDAGRPKRTLHLCAPASAVKVEQRSRY
ncbi:MAG TPA: hypothetical protein VGC41_15775, partial [Kofleriaceae bacterium]